MSIAAHWLVSGLLVRRRRAVAGSNGTRSHTISALKTTGTPKTCSAWSRMPAAGAVLAPDLLVFARIAESRFTILSFDFDFDMNPPPRYVRPRIAGPCSLDFQFSISTLLLFDFLILDYLNFSNTR
jgi:hypothetical protein